MGCTCTFDLPPKNSREFRSKYICPKPGNSEFYNSNCIENTCEACKDWQKLPQCICLVNHPEVECEFYENIPYKNKYGEEKMKKDFVKRKKPFDDFWEYMVGYRSKFLRHWTRAKWQTKQCHHLENSLELRHAVPIPDFSENYHIERTLQHQSEYFVEVSITLYTCVMI